MQKMQSANKWTRDYIYDTNNQNRLLKHDDQQTTDDYAYDQHGNILQMPNIPTMEWDYQNQLHKAISGTVTAFYNYDANGERARKVAEKSGGIREERIYFGNFEIYRKYVSEVLETERRTLHISDGTKNIAFIETLTVENGTAVSTLQDVLRYQYDNHLGSSSLELDESANVISYEEYHPFGTSSYRLHRNNTEASLKRYRYVGKERDEETGLYYYGARYYAAWIGRWMSVDPMANERVWLNPYNYCQNNPINRIDPSGALDDDPPKGEKAVTRESSTKDAVIISADKRFEAGWITMQNIETGYAYKKFENTKSVQDLKKRFKEGDLKEHTMKIAMWNENNPNKVGAREGSSGIYILNPNKELVHISKVETEDINENSKIVAIITIEGNKTVDDIKTLGHEVFLHVIDDINKIDKILEYSMDNKSKSEAINQVNRENDVLIDGIVKTLGGQADHAKIINKTAFKYQKFSQEVRYTLNKNEQSEFDESTKQEYEQYFNDPWCRYEAKVGEYAK